MNTLFQEHVLSPGTAFSFRFNELIWALSETLDLVGVKDIAHGKRVAFTMLELSRHLDNSYIQDDLYLAGLLHDCGVSTTSDYESLLGELEWDQVQAHCVRGSKLLASQPWLEHLQLVILHHHTPWEKLKTLDIPEDQKILANLLFLSDRFDALSRRVDTQSVENRNAIIAALQDLSPRLFHPDLLEALRQSAEQDFLWHNRNTQALEDYFSNWLEEDPWQDYAYDESLHFFQLFADCVDGKSSFTYNHSKGVSNLSMYLSGLMGLPGSMVRQLGVAGCLHDLGKLRVPDYIMEKNGPLDAHETLIMKKQSLDTLHILQKVPGFQKIAVWAGSHHEFLDGSGYPYQKRAEEIDLGARIISVSDIFQALCQVRPYREANLSEGRIRRILYGMVKEHQLDPDVSQVVFDYYDECLSCATQAPLLSA